MNKKDIKADKTLAFKCILQLDLSEYEKGILEDPDAFTVAGYWRCDNCANGYRDFEQKAPCFSYGDECEQIINS